MVASIEIGANAIIFNVILSQSINEDSTAALLFKPFNLLSKDSA
jgi:hypothetical protein